MTTRTRFTWIFLVGLLAPGSLAADAPKPSPRPNASEVVIPVNPSPVSDSKPTAGLTLAPSLEDLKGLRSVALLGLASLAPAALLMFTSFVRINIVLTLVRQALGSPQVPGNQVLAALSLLLSTLVMAPVGKTVYEKAVRPCLASEITPAQAWDVGSAPIARFMADQIVRTNHGHYLVDLYDLAEPPTTPGRYEPEEAHQFPLRVIAPAFLLSELTTALMIGFVIYLPFLVIDLVVSAVLSAMGLFMLPPSLVAMPLKLVLFVLADGWLLVSTALLRTFAV